MHVNAGETTWVLCDAGYLPRQRDRSVVAVDEGEMFALYDCSLQGVVLIGYIETPRGQKEVLARRLADCDMVLMNAARADLHASLTAHDVPIRRLGRGERVAAVLTGWGCWRDESRAAGAVRMR